MIVFAFIASLKLAATLVFKATPLSLAAGLVELTVGAVTSGATPVVKLQVWALCKALPASSLAPVLTVAAQVVEAGSVAEGVNVATLPLNA